MLSETNRLIGSQKSLNPIVFFSQLLQMPLIWVIFEPNEMNRLIGSFFNYLSITSITTYLGHF